MAQSSIFQALNNKNAILSVFTDQVIILRSSDPWSAIGTQDLDGCTCLLAMGTSPGSAIVVARIGCLPIESVNDPHSGGTGECQSMANIDEHFMSLTRKVIRVIMSNSNLFQMPIVYGIFGQHKGKVLLADLKERARKVFSHLDMDLRFSFYEVQHLTGMQQSSEASEVVAVQHPTKMPELYVGNRLAYPLSHSGYLALIFDSLGIEQDKCNKGSDACGNDHDNGRLE